MNCDAAGGVAGWTLKVDVRDANTGESIKIVDSVAEEVVRWMVQGAVLEFHGRRILATPRVDVGTRTVTICGEVFE